MLLTYVANKKAVVSFANEQRQPVILSLNTGRTRTSGGSAARQAFAGATSSVDFTSNLKVLHTVPHCSYNAVSTA